MRAKHGKGITVVCLSVEGGGGGEGVAPCYNTTAIESQYQAN